MLNKRIFSAVIGILIFIFFIFWGSLPFAFLILMITFIALNEYNKLIPVGTNKNRLLLLFFSLFIILITYLTNSGIINWPPGIIVSSSLILFFTLHIFFHEYQGIFETLAYNLFGLVYIGGGMAFFLLLRDADIAPLNQTRALWLVLIATWATDSGAYFIGSYFGKRKLAVKISPNKTIEGAVGGIIFSILTVVIFTVLISTFNFHWIIYGLLVSIIAMAGDLFESSIKRDMGVKDSGALIPGHGGILDRFDSLLFAVPFTYYYLSLFL